MKSYSFDQLYPMLQSLQKPGRYVGGEFGVQVKQEKPSIRVALCFPDLYEIGMSNQAIKILYNLMNSIEGVVCERVFAPAKDFEEALRENQIYLYSLESFRPLKDFDILAFSVGYELSLTNILAVLDSAGIPIKIEDRSSQDPIVIAGGPALNNPLPFSLFIDYIFMGEAEAALTKFLTEGVSQLTDSTSKKQQLTTLLKKETSFWYKDKKDRTPLAKWMNFSQEPSYSSGVPIPSISIVQDQGVVEIMRGCPNKCRFCHAGCFYRPVREKSWQCILDEVDFLVKHCGYRNITLSSLSTGDFHNIDKLVRILNERYSKLGVSFNLPSLRVNSISLELLGLVSVVRKSGLTFAVEAPTEEGQMGLNKDVSTERILKILKEAREKGWKLAKFYFMLGLPVNDTESEAQQIIDYLNHIQHESRMQINVNIGTFIPKVFTPYSREKQLNESSSLEKILFIKRNINNKRIRISYHSPFASYLEGILSRGDESSGELAYQAYLAGARLDAWEEHLNRDLWKELIGSDNAWEKRICLDNRIQDRLDEIIDSTITMKHFQKEKDLSMKSAMTQACSYPCKDHCGVCNKNLKAERVEELIPDTKDEESFERVEPYDVIIKFDKKDRAIFWGHLDVMRVMERTMIRCGIEVLMTQGFNPKPKMEFSSPLSLGISSDCEYLCIQVDEETSSLLKKLKELNDHLPDGLSILDHRIIENQKKVKMMKFFNGSQWEFKVEDNARKDKLKQWLLTNGKDLGIEIVAEKDQSITIDSRARSNSFHNPLKLLKEVFHMENPLSDPAILKVKRLAQYAGDAVELSDRTFLNFFSE